MAHAKGLKATHLVFALLRRAMRVLESSPSDLCGDSRIERTSVSGDPPPKKLENFKILLSQRGYTVYKLER